MTRTRLPRPGEVSEHALSHWIVGAVVGLLTVGPLLWLLFMGIMILSS